MCSHDYRDQRFINQLVYNWPVAPYFSDRHDGEPDHAMQYGQTYECNRCHHIMRPERPTKGKESKHECLE